jgi:hypothetical protein
MKRRREQKNSLALPFAKFWIKIRNKNNFRNCHFLTAGGKRTRIYRLILSTGFRTKLRCRVLNAINSTQTNDTATQARHSIKRCKSLPIFQLLQSLFIHSFSNAFFEFPRQLFAWPVDTAQRRKWKQVLFFDVGSNRSETTAVTSRRGQLARVQVEASRRRRWRAAAT